MLFKIVHEYTKNFEEKIEKFYDKLVKKCPILEKCIKIDHEKKVKLIWNKFRKNLLSNFYKIKRKK